jgi:hypothetical protein
MTRLLRLLRCAPLAAAVGAAHAPRAQPDGLARAESAYARAVATLGDSAVHRLDFFPARAQLRVQLAFLDPRAASVVPFGALARLSADAAPAVADLADRLGGVAAPADLDALHASLRTALDDATAALTHLAAAATACAADAGSVARCQAPFTEASSRLARAYARYLDARRRVRDRITDTGTVLPAFDAPSRM